MKSCIDGVDVFLIQFHPNQYLFGCYLYLNKNNQFVNDFIDSKTKIHRTVIW